MTAKYRIRRSYSQNWSKPLDLGPVLDKADAMMEAAGGPFRLKTNAEADDEWGPELTRPRARAKLKAQLPLADVGVAWYVDNARLWHIHIRKVDVAPVIPDTPGTSPIDIARYYILRAYRLESWGVCNCRRVAGSSSWSQHAWCNAEDYHASYSVMEEASRWIANAALGNVKDVPKLPVSQIIFSSRMWTSERPYFTYVSGIGHYDHIHISGAPLRTGWPPCA